MSGKKYDLVEYKFALKVCKDFPELLKLLETFRKTLKPYANYVTIRALIDDIDNRSENLSKNITYYNRVKDRKGVKGE